MKGLRKYIYPFAPDQSGAVSVLYELGGIIVICDAGGCAGNICGFDEPRWFTKKSAVFSAGLRDMDAILGRDDKMVEKIQDTAAKIDASFIALIGTPVPATIATDYAAIRTLTAKRIGLPVLTVETNGIRPYDAGAQKSYEELFRVFAEDVPAGNPGIASTAQTGAAGGVCEEATGDSVNAAGWPDPAVIAGSIGVLGATPIDLGSAGEADRIIKRLLAEGASLVNMYGMRLSAADPDMLRERNLLDGIRMAGRMERNLVIAPSGLKTAKYLKKRFGTPYTCTYPAVDLPALQQTWAPELKELSELSGKKILLIHQQIYANALREAILRQAEDADITVASWFELKAECKKPQDVRIKEEDAFLTLLQDGGYDVIIADTSFQKAAKAQGFAGTWLNLPHFAVSGVWPD